MRKKPMLAYPVSDKPINYDNDVFRKKCEMKNSIILK